MENLQLQTAVMCYKLWSSGTIWGWWVFRSTFRSSICCLQAQFLVSPPSYWVNKLFLLQIRHTILTLFIEHDGKCHKVKEMWRRIHKDLQNKATITLGLHTKKRHVHCDITHQFFDALALWLPPYWYFVPKYQLRPASLVSKLHQRAS